MQWSLRQIGSPMSGRFSRLLDLYYVGGHPQSHLLCRNFSAVTRKVTSCHTLPQIMEVPRDFSSEN